jgi:hypothetical protein
MFVWENSGNTPAIDGVSSGNLRGLNAEPTEKQFQGTFDVSDLTKVTIGPKDTARSNPFGGLETIFFGKDLGDLAKIPSQIPPPPIVGKVFVWGWIMYRDIFRTKIHLTEFCLRCFNSVRSEDGSAIRLDFTATKEHNCTDDWCPDYQEMVSLYPK